MKKVKINICVSLILTAGILFAQDIKISKEEPLTIGAKSVRGNSKTKEVVYSGDVILEHAGNTLMGDKVTLLANNDKIVGEKNIKFFNKEKTFDIRGGFVEYYKSTKYLLMKESPVLVSKDRENIITKVRSDKMELYQQEDRARVEGNVEMEREDIRTTCGLANYDRREDKILLEGKPLVLKEMNSFEGDVITLYVKKRLLVADKNVKAVIFPEELKDKEKKE